MLIEFAHGTKLTDVCLFRGGHRTLMVRRDHKRAIVATAHKKLWVVHAVLRDAQPDHDSEAHCEALMVSRNAPRWIRMLRQYN